jgi:hypothetical protein
MMALPDFPASHKAGSGLLLFNTVMTHNRQAIVPKGDSYVSKGAQEFFSRFFFH